MVIEVGHNNSTKLKGCVCGFNYHAEGCYRGRNLITGRKLLPNYPKSVT